MEAADRIRITALCSVQFIDVLGVTVVVTALPRMLASLHASPAAGSLVSGGYAMFFGGLLMLGARLGDRFGHRRVITAGLAVSGLGALAGAVAGSVVLLTAARCLQGAGAAASVPSALRLLTVLVPDGPARRRAIAGWSASGALAGASGFVVGGVVTDLASWRWVFWAYLPLTAALAAFMVSRVPRDVAGSRREPLNAPAAATFTVTVMAVVVGTTLIAQPAGRTAGAVVVLLAAPLTAVFIGVDRRARAPLLPAAVLAVPDLRAGAAGAFINTATTSSAMTLATLYLQDGLRHSPLAAAAMLLPFSLAVIAGSALAAPALRQTSARLVLAAGLGVIALADAGLAVSGLGVAASAVWPLPGCVAAAGAGLGLASVAATTLGTAVPEALRGAAAGIVNTAGQLGTAVGIAVLLLIAAATSGPPGVRAPVAGWAAAAAIGTAGAFGFARSFRGAGVRRRAVSTARATVSGAGSDHDGRKTMKFMMLVCVDGAESDGAESDGADSDGAESDGAGEVAAEADGGSFPWLDDVIARGIRLDGDRLRPPAEAKTVLVRDGETMIIDGPFAETKEVICGFDILDCADIDEAVEVAAAHPVAQFGRIEVRPFWP